MHDFQESKYFDSEIKGLLCFYFLIGMSSIVRSSHIESRVFSCDLAGSSHYLPRWCKFHTANWVCFSALSLDLVIGFEIRCYPRSVADGLRSSAVPPAASSFATTGCETSVMSFRAPFSRFFQSLRYCWARFFFYSSLWSYQPLFRGSATNCSISVVCLTSYANCQAFDSVLIFFRKSSSHEIPSCRLVTSGDLLEHVGILPRLYMATYPSAVVHNWTFAFSAAEDMRRDCPHQALHPFLESMMNHDALWIGGSRPSFVDFCSHSL